MRLAELVDLFLSEGSRIKSKSWQKNYGHATDRLLREVGEKTLVEHVTREDCLRTLATWNHTKPATQHLNHTAIKKLFDYALDRGYVGKTPMWGIEAPKIPKPEDRDVVIVSTQEVVRMFQACEDWADEICLGVIVYTGSRLHAAAQLRWRDVDLEPDPPHAPYGWMRFQEKGGKKPSKPIPAVLREILDRAPALSEGKTNTQRLTGNAARTALESLPSESACAPDAYVVPNYGPIKGFTRQDGIIWIRVKKIAKRAGVRAHVHALRAAFAVFFLEHHGGSDRALQQWLGHESLETTRHYTRNLNRKKLLSEGLGLDWGSLTSPTGVLPEGSEGWGTSREPQRAKTLARGLPSERTSEGALSGEGSNLQSGVKDGYPSASSPESALPEDGVLPPASEVGRGPASKIQAWTPSSESASMSRQEESHEQVAAHHELDPSPDVALLPNQLFLFLELLMTRLRGQGDTDNATDGVDSGTLVANKPQKVFTPRRSDV